MMGGLVRWLSSLFGGNLGPFPLGFVLDLDQMDRELQGVEAIEFNGFRWVSRYRSCLFGDGFVGSQSKKGDGRMIVMDWIALKLKPGLRLGGLLLLIRCSKVRCTSHQV